MAAPTRYDWTMPNAPVARGERRSLHDILYACLCTGFGDKPGAGWTREWVNATFDKAVFRPGAGTRFYLQVDGAGSLNANTSNLKAYETMTSVDDGLFPFKTTFAVNDRVATSYNVSTTARPWVLVADDRAFYFVCWTNATSAPADTDVITSFFFFGDGVSRYAIDPYFCILASIQQQVGYGSSWAYMAGPEQANAGPLAVPRAISGVAAPILSHLIRGGGPGSSQYPGQQGVPYTVGDQIMISRPHVNDHAGYTFRGWLPGFYYPCHAAPFSNLATINADGKSFLSIRNVITGQSNVNILISLDDWRA